MDFRPASFKVQIVHIRFHQLDAPPVFGDGVRREAITNKRFEVEPFPLIRHNDGYFIAGLAAGADVHFCFWIFLIAMHDCIVERFPERQLDTELFSRNASRCFNQPHQTVHKRRDRSDLLGIQKSISRMEDWERFPENCD
jgi:hypothetical protein